MGGGERHLEKKRPHLSGPTGKLFLFLITKCNINQSCKLEEQTGRCQNSRAGFIGLRGWCPQTLWLMLCAQGYRDHSLQDLRSFCSFWSYRVWYQAYELLLEIAGSEMSQLPTLTFSGLQAVWWGLPKSQNSMGREQVYWSLGPVLRLWFWGVDFL